MARLLGFHKPGDELVIARSAGDVVARIPPETREQMQYVFSRLELHGAGLPFSVGITSSMAGEGVSFVGRALAAVLSEDVGRRICLVRANWWSEGEEIDTVNPGLSGLLGGTATLDEVLVPTRYPRLTILPSGQVPTYARSPLAKTEPMIDVLDRLRSRFDHVLVDLPAIETTAGSLTLCAATDGVIVVVRQRTTTIDQVERSVDDLRHTTVLGVVLNDNHVALPAMLQRRLLDA